MGPNDDDRELFLRTCKNSDLPKFALQAFLERRDFEAIALVDRWRRTAQPTPQAFLLRAQALFRIGRRTDAIDNLLQALNIESTHRTANLRLFEWGDASQRKRAAKALIDRDESLLDRTLSILAGDGAQGLGKIKLRAQRLAGWCVWRPGKSVRLEVGDAAGVLATTWIAPDASHRLAGVFGAAADISSNFPFAPKAFASLLVEDEVVSQVGGPGADFDPGDAEPVIDCDPGSVTIIVPVYEDAEATRHCLEALNQALEATPEARVVVIDDASPNREIKRYLSETFPGPRRTVVANRRNLGYLGSVNRALGLIEAGDVILLNSDTIPLASFVDDMRAIARSDPRIGAINPLSNNGEFVSFPKPFQYNAFDRDSLSVLASCAAAANRGMVVDVPAGTGFCLYVTRACLNAVGKLSTDFKRGYLEDADFGLRARENGYRTVCATGIFVAHIGSRSFQAEKTALVQRNNLTLERKFPSYFPESKAFVEADPLSEARSKIEALVPLAQVRRLLIGPQRRTVALCECANRLRDAGVDVLMAAVTPRQSGWSATLEACDGTVPQALKIDALPDAQAAQELERHLRTWRFDRVELLDLLALPESVVSLAEKLGIPVDLVAADATLGAETRLRAWSNPGSCEYAREASIGSQPCARCRAEAGPDYTTEARRRLMRLERRYESMIFLDESTQQSWTPSLKAGSPTRTTPVLRRRVSQNPEGFLEGIAPHHDREFMNIGILLPQETTSALRLVFLFAERFSLMNARGFLFGATSVDERLIGSGVFVCGRVPLSERETVLLSYEIDALILPYRSGFSWLLDEFRASTPLPAAYFGASPVSRTLSEVDLAIDPRVCDRRAASLFSQWLTSSESKRLSGGWNRVAKFDA